MINNTALFIQSQKNTSSTSGPFNASAYIQPSRAPDNVCPATLNSNPKKKIVSLASRVDWSHLTVTDSSKSFKQDGIFEWDKETQSLILVAYYVGQMTAQVSWTSGTSRLSCGSNLNGISTFYRSPEAGFHSKLVESVFWLCHYSWGQYSALWARFSLVGTGKPWSFAGSSSACFT